MAADRRKASSGSTVPVRLKVTLPGGGTSAVAEQLSGDYILHPGGKARRREWVCDFPEIC